MSSQPLLRRGQARRAQQRRLEDSAQSGADVDELYAVLAPSGSPTLASHVVDAFRKTILRCDSPHGHLRAQVASEFKPVDEFEVCLGMILHTLDGNVASVSDVGDVCRERPLSREEFRAIYAVCRTGEGLPLVRQFAQVACERLRALLFEQSPRQIRAAVIRTHCLFDTVFAHVDINTGDSLGDIDGRVTPEELINAFELLSATPHHAARLLFPSPSSAEAAEPGPCPGQIINDFYQAHEGDDRRGLDKPQFQRLLLELMAPRRSACEASTLNLWFAAFVRDRALQLQLASLNRERGTVGFRWRTFLRCIFIPVCFPLLGLPATRLAHAAALEHLDEQRHLTGARASRLERLARERPLAMAGLAYATLTLVWVLVFVPPAWWTDSCMSGVASSYGSCCFSGFEAFYPPTIVLGFVAAFAIYQANHAEVDPVQFKTVRLLTRLRGLTLVCRMFETGRDQSMPAKDMLQHLQPPQKLDTLMANVMAFTNLDVVNPRERLGHVLFIGAHGTILALMPGIVRSLPNDTLDTQSCGMVVRGHDGAFSLATVFDFAYIPFSFLVTVALSLALLRLSLQFETVSLGIERLGSLFNPAFSSIACEGMQQRLPGFLDAALPENVAGWSKLRQYWLTANSRSMEALQVLLACVVSLSLLFTGALLAVLLLHHYEPDSSVTWDTSIIAMGLAFALLFMIVPLLRVLFTVVRINFQLMGHVNMLHRVRYRLREAAALDGDPPPPSVGMISDLIAIMECGDTPVTVLGVVLTPAVTQTFVLGVLTTAASSVYTYASRA